MFSKVAFPQMIFCCMVVMSVFASQADALDSEEAA